MPRPPWTEIQAELLKYRRDELIRLLLKVNVITTLGAFDEVIARQAVLVNQLYPRLWRLKILYWMKEGRFEFVLPREVTLTALAKALTLPEGSFGTEPVDAHMQEIGPLLSKIACHASRMDDAAFDSAGSDEKRELLAGHIFRSFYFRQSVNVGSQIGRWWGMLTRGLPEVSANRKVHFDFDSVAARSVGLSLPELLLATMAVWAHYANNAEELIAGRRPFWFHPGYLSAVGKDPARGKEILARLTSDLDELSRRLLAGEQNEPFSCASAFYDHPVVRLDANSIAAPDMTVLEYNLGPGLFWRTFLALRDDGDREHLKTAIGYAFEWYAGNLIKDAYPDSCALDWDGTCPKLPGVPTPDAIVSDDGSLYLIEATTMAPKPSTSLGGDWNAIKHELEEIWFGRGAEEESAKLLQLYGALQACKSGRLDLSRIWKGNSSRMVPVLLLANPLPQQLGLRDHFRGIMRSQGRLDEEFINQVLFLDIGELEGLLALRHEGNSITQFIQGWKNSDLADQSLNNYLVARLVKIDRPRILKDLMTEAFEEMQALMRPGG